MSIEMKNNENYTEGKNTMHFVQALFNLVIQILA